MRASRAAPRPLAGSAALLLPAVASAHARVSPAVSVAGKLQLYSLAVPTEKSGLTTTKIVMTVPAGFGIDSFVPPPPGWHMQVQQTGSGDSAVVTQGDLDRRPARRPARTRCSSSSPSRRRPRPTRSRSSRPTRTARSSTGRDRSPRPRRRRRSRRRARSAAAASSVLTIVALIVGVLGLLAGGFALVGGSRERTLA